MENIEEKNSRDSITYEVIRYVTLYYFSIAILLTIGQIVFEYYDIKRDINYSISELKKSFNTSLTNSLWEFNSNQTDAILAGIIQSPSVIALKLVDANENLISTKNLEAINEKKIEQSNILTLFKPDSIFEYKQTLTKILDNGQKEDVGSLYVYSGNIIILEHLSRIILYIIVNSIIKTISLWLILIAFFNKKVKAPLNEFIKRITSVDSKNPSLLEVDNQFETEELFQIQESFNELIVELKNYRDVLEAIIDNKTELIKEKNIEVRKLISKLEDAQDQIVNQEKLNSLGLVSAGIAHELKNPLNLSKNSIIIIKDLFGMKEEQDEGFEFNTDQIDAGKMKTLPSVINMLVESTRRMESIITNMLLQSRSEYTKPTQVNLNSFVSMNLRVVQKSLRDNAGTASKITIDIDQELNIDVFPNELGRLLVNLFENSFYALSERMKLSEERNEEYTPTLNVTVASFGTNKILLTIHDNGIGIPKKIQKKIMEPFFTTKPTGLGTGLGLYLSYEIVKKHHGEIIINSDENSFTEIQIRLPLDLASMF